MSNLSLVVQMYRPSQYESWEEAEKLGGIHGVAVHSITSLGTIGERMVFDDIVEAILTSVDCVDGNETVELRIMEETSDGVCTYTLWENL